MAAIAQLLENLAPWIRLQRAETLAQLLLMLGAELQRREIPSAPRCFELAREVQELTRTYGERR